MSGSHKLSDKNRAEDYRNASKNDPAERSTYPSDVFGTKGKELKKDTDAENDRKKRNANKATRTDESANLFNFEMK